MYQPPPQKSVGRRPSLAQPGALLAARARPGRRRVGRACVGLVKCVWWPSGPRRAASRARASQGPRRPRPRRRPAVACSAAIARPPGRRSCSAANARPDLVVERSFDVARDHCVPFRRRGRHRATHTTRAPSSWWSSPPRPSRGCSRSAIERDEILEEYVEKSDTFARTLVASGTFGFLPDVPSAYTQPLYAWFLAALYWPLERSWVVVGLAQIAVAVATALLVLAIGTRLSSVATGVIAALVATLHPYLVWHDVHVNREILDGLLAAAIVLLALVAYERRSPLAALALGAVGGLAILSNARLAAAAARARPVRRVARSPAGRAVAAAVLVVVGGRGGDRAVGRPQPGRDRLRDDHDRHARALEGEQPGDVRRPRARRLDRRRARAAGRAAVAGEGGRRSRSRPRRRSTSARRRPSTATRCSTSGATQPGEKARLALQAVGMLWSPFLERRRPTTPGQQGLSDLAQRTVEPAFVILLYALALWGAFLAPRRFVALAAAPARLQHARRRWCSPERCATARRGTSCSRCWRRSRSSAPGRSCASGAPPPRSSAAR